VAPALRLQSLHAGASHALIIGNGGPAMFAGFRATPEARDGQRDPLDRFTRMALSAAAAEALAGQPGGYRLLFPFTDSVPALPFQRLGRAAGLGGPGPLGLQIHPVYGPWWAYRGLIALALPPAAKPALVTSPSEVGDGCAGCAAPCVAACPAGAVRRDGFSVVACHARRLVAPDCQLSCVARIRCVRGPEHRYSDQQLAFHMAASMPRAPA
jgi:ferredoxin